MSIKEKCVPVIYIEISIQNGHNCWLKEFVFGYEVKKGKPAPDIFLRACEKIGENPEDCLVLEDSEAGIEAAFSADIPVICIPDMKVPNQHFLDMTSVTLSSLDEVITYLTIWSKPS